MDTQLSFADTAVALSLDYECVFFVDVENANYAMYAFHGNHKSMKLTESSDFWADTRVNLQTVVYEEDRQSFNDTVSKDFLLAAVKNDRTFTYKYRIAVDGQPVWYKMKVVLGQSKQRDYLIIGVNNIDEQERNQIDLERKASKSATYGQIVMALAERYDALYMVDLKTDHYVQYKSERSFCELSIALEGEDFFNQLRKDALSVIYKDDIELITKALTREVLLKELDDYGVFSLTYRLNTMTGPQYVKLIAVLSKSEVYGQIVMALAERYEALYMVDLTTDHFAQYKAERVYSDLSVAAEGEDFFNQLQKDAETVVYNEDLSLIRSALERESLLRELDENGLFTISYRLNSPKGPLYVSLVAVYSDKTHMVISVTNIDAQVRREQKIREEASLAFERARRDDLTGVKNRNAYGEFEKKIDEQIRAGEEVEFAIAIFDVNGLKTVNDTQGHMAGDQYIRTASKLVCETFKHSPVFRVGGDEFVAILRGTDFEKREELRCKLLDIVKKNAKEHKVVVACGISIFNKQLDKRVASVFERADAMMFQNKESLKGECN